MACDWGGQQNQNQNKNKTNTADEPQWIGFFVRNINSRLASLPVLALGAWLALTLAYKNKTNTANEPQWIGFFIRNINSRLASLPVLALGAWRWHCDWRVSGICVRSQRRGGVGWGCWVVGFDVRGDGRNSVKTKLSGNSGMRQEKEWAPKRSDNSSLNINLRNNACAQSPPWLDTSCSRCVHCPCRASNRGWVCRTPPSHRTRTDFCRADLFAARVHTNIRSKSSYRTRRISSDGEIVATRHCMLDIFC